MRYTNEIKSYIILDEKKLEVVKCYDGKLKPAIFWSRRQAYEHAKHVCENWQIIIAKHHNPNVMGLCGSTPMFAPYSDIIRHIDILGEQDRLDWNLEFNSCKSPENYLFLINR